MGRPGGTANPVRAVRETVQAAAPAPIAETVAAAQANDPMIGLAQGKKPDLSLEGAKGRGAALTDPAFRVLGIDNPLGSKKVDGGGAPPPPSSEGSNADPVQQEMAAAANEQRKARGRAATMLTGSSGLEGSDSTSGGLAGGGSSLMVSRRRLLGA